MLNWFQEVFSSTAEQGRLFTTLISVALAIFILLLNQWFLKRKSRRELLIDKLEKLATALYGFQRVAVSLNHSFFIEQKVDTEKQTELVILTSEIEMLSKLYFKGVSFDLGIGSTIVSCGYDHLSEEPLRPGDSIPADHPYIEFNEELNEFNIYAEKTLDLMASKYVK